MITLVGKVFKDSVEAGNASVQVYVYDPANNIAEWSDVTKTDTAGRYQISFLGIRDLHQNFSDSTEILVAAWDDDEDRTSTHEYLGTSIIQYQGEALSISDVDLLEANQCSYELINNSISITQKERIPYTPIFESTNQASFFHNESVFPQSNVAEVLVYDGTSYIEPYDISFQEIGEFQIPIQGTSVGGVTFSGVLNVTTIAADAEEPIVFETIEIDRGLAFFVVRDRGIKDNIFNASMYTSQQYTLTNVKFFADDIMVREITDFSTPLVSIALSGISGNIRHMKMVATGTIEGSMEEVEYIYEKDVHDFGTISGDIAVSLDPDTGLHTAALNINNSSEAVEILWQIVYSSTVVERVLKVSNAEEKALINILYQEYTSPDNLTLEFEALQPGNYSIIAYVINSSGAFFKISEDLFVPGGGSEEQPIEVGDSITIGCLSNHGEVPILGVYRLSREGYEEVLSAPMDHAFERTYFYDYTVESDDSFYIFKAADSVVVKKVGEPRGCAIAYSKNKDTGRTIEYQLQDFNGNTIDTGVLDDSGFGVYYKVMSENVHGVLMIGNTYKVV
jgi:hypothetical protein